MVNYGLPESYNIPEYASEYGNDIKTRTAYMCAQALAATMAAVDAAAERTPVNAESKPAGTGMRTGAMKAHWASDSRTRSRYDGDEFTTELANKADEYVSYVNDGHRLDKYFVPGLVINSDSGLLERDPDGKGGIWVGTKTSYVPGIKAVEVAKEAYEDVLERELKKIVEELL
jgi:hypothetical protein